MFNWEYLRGETYVWALQMMMMMASQAEKVVMTLEMAKLNRLKEPKSTKNGSKKTYSFSGYY